MFDIKALLADPLRLLPFMRWIGRCRDIKVLQADVIAGITVALVLVPQSMAQVCGVARVVPLTTMVPSVALHN